MIKIQTVILFYLPIYISNLEANMSKSDPNWHCLCSDAAVPVWRSLQQLQDCSSQWAAVEGTLPWHHILLDTSHFLYPKETFSIYLFPEILHSAVWESLIAVPVLQSSSGCITEQSSLSNEALYQPLKLGRLPQIGFVLVAPRWICKFLLPQPHIYKLVLLLYFSVLVAQSVQCMPVA